MISRDTILALARVLGLQQKILASMHNASRSSQSGVSTIQPGEPTAEVFETSRLEKHVLYHAPQKVVLLLLRIYKLHVIRRNTST